MTKHDELLRTAKKRIEEAYSADQVHRERAASDMRFLVGEGQWREEDRSAREADGRPCLTFNRMPQFVRKVTAQIRSLNPGVKVLPGDDRASDEVAKVMGGLIRQIEAKCDAASIYEGAAESAAACGIGYWRVRNRYCEGLTFDQEIAIEPIRNAFAVFVDPAAREPTRADARYMFVAETIPRDEFESQFPDATVGDFTTENNPTGAQIWGGTDTVTVAEYYWIEDEEVEIGLLPDGQVIRDPKPPVMFIARRKVMIPKVKWAKLSYSDVLEGPQDVPGRYIPVVAVTGEEWHIGEQTYRSSVIRFAKDAQVLYNFSRSVGAEVMGTQTRAPWLVTIKQISGLEDAWAGANSNQAYLPYTPDDKAPPPQRIAPPVPSSAVTAEIQMASEDMKATTGIYDAALGARGNETSGIAIQQRQQESESSTSAYADNMVRSVRHTGRIMLDMIPVVYDTARVIRILGDDDEEQAVRINTVMTEAGIAVVENDMSAGIYEARVTVGPTYQSKREESAAGMMDFLRAIPQAAPVVADLVAGMQDWPEADRVADRLKKQLPPGLAEDDDPQAQQQAAMQQQMAAEQQQQAMQAQQQDMALKLREQEAKTRQAEANAAKAEAEAMEAQARLALASGQLNAGMVPVAPMGAFTGPQGA